MKSPPQFARTGLMLTAAVALGCAPRAAPGPVSPGTRPAPAAPRIVFASDRSGPWRIWTVKPDGSGMRQLTRAAADEHDVDPAFSLDGRSILLTSTRGGKPGVWKTPIDGVRPERICDGDQAEWAPDGKRIVFTRNGRILTRDLAGGAERIVSGRDYSNCSGPSWSPDGKTIAFAARRGRDNAIFTVAAAGGKPTKVYDEKGACEPHWSPDGERIVYETETHICTVRHDGTDNRLITYYGGVQRYARYSPDGKWLVFCQAPSPRGPWELYVVPAGGGAPRKLTDGGSDMHPDWR